jgi:alpha-galactosidase
MVSLVLLLAGCAEPSRPAPVGRATPAMGWNTFFSLGGDPTETEIRDIADEMVSDGLRDAGYRIVWIDGNWAAPTPRDSAGELVEDPDRFPSGLRALTDHLHSLGFQAGIYTDAGPYLEGTCGLGSYGHYREDVRQFARWGFDALKADWLCGRAADLDPETQFRELAAAVSRSSRPMILNICNPVTEEWGDYPEDRLASWTWTYAPGIADSWRTSTDVTSIDPAPGLAWTWTLRNLDANAEHPEATTPGHVNDPDYLIPMRATELTFEESKSQLGLWAMMSSPLILGSDPRTLPSGMLAALRNPELIDIDQDPLVKQAVPLAANPDIWSKPLSGTRRSAVAVLNRASTPRTFTVPLEGRTAVRDVWARADRGVHETAYTVTVPAHGLALLTLRS